jgi:hypothetical protein
VLWDGSVWEKPESLKSEGLGPVQSGKARRLTHIKPGYYPPPGRPICVPGLHWISLLLLGRSTEQGPARLITMRWWTGASGSGPAGCVMRNANSYGKWRDNGGAWSCTSLIVATPVGCG